MGWCVCSSASVLSGRKGGMTAVNKGRMMFDFSNMSSQMGSVTAQQHEDTVKRGHISLLGHVRLQNHGY